MRQLGHWLSLTKLTLGPKGPQSLTWLDARDDYFICAQVMRVSKGLTKVQIPASIDSFTTLEQFQIIDWSISLEKC